MTYVNEHKILGEDNESIAEVTVEKELRTNDLSTRDLLIEAVQTLRKIEYHMSILTATDLTNDEI